MICWLLYLVGYVELGIFIDSITCKTDGLLFFIYLENSIIMITLLNYSSYPSNYLPRILYIINSKGSL